MDDRRVDEVSTETNRCHVEDLTSPHGHKLSCKYWNFNDSARKARCLVFISHGVTEHAMCYEELVKKLTEHDCLVFAHDHVGHGLSGGDRVHVDDFSIYCEDVVAHVKKIKEKHPGLPCFIVGHSMGGTIAICATLDNEDVFAGVVLVSPGIIPDDKNVQFYDLKIFLSKVAGKVMPQLQVASVNHEFVSRDVGLCKKFTEDPLVWHGGIKARWVCCLLKAFQYIKDHFEEITFPYLLIHGTDDKICALAGSEVMYEKSSSKDKTFKVFQEAYHQVHNEPGETGVTARNDIVNWIVARAPVAEREP